LSIGKIQMDVLEVNTRDEPVIAAEPFRQSFSAFQIDHEAPLSVVTAYIQPTVFPAM
jgi:hypothetical protein